MSEFDTPMESAEVAHAPERDGSVVAIILPVVAIVLGGLIAVYSIFMLPTYTAAQAEELSFFQNYAKFIGFMIGASVVFAGMYFHPTQRQMRARSKRK